MNRAEFMRRLTELLRDVPPMEREEAIQYYNDYFDDAGAENESGVIASLGTPEELARTIKAGLNDGGNGGEFTESGFSGYTQVHKDEVMRAEETSRQTNGADYSAQSGAQTGNAYYEQAYYQRTDGKGVYGGREDTRRQSNPYEQQGQNAGYTAGGQQTQQPKQGMSGGMIALIIIVAVLTFPIWIGLVAGLFGIVVGIFAALFGIFAAFLSVGVVLVVVSIALLIAGIALLFSMPLGGLCVIGTSLILFALGLVFIWLMVLIVATVIPALVKGIAALGRRIFRRGGAQA
ncbi:MAG: DUF1700 domain-containing protein [Lachnospiraceae bacterium]|nr:DUF1700 domain-containing protein [Lachnospiraceae bacterium]